MIIKEELTMNELEELRRDAYDEVREESQKEHKLRADYNYALDNSGLDNAIDSLADVLKFMNKYGYEMSMKDLLEEI